VANAPFYFIHEKVKGDIAYGETKININRIILVNTEVVIISPQINPSRKGENCR
jgi:hypothetical protein